MKKQLFTLLFGSVLGISNLCALRPGDVAEELSTVTWVQGEPVPMNTPDSDTMKALVFLRTRSADSAGILQMLQALRLQYASTLQCAAITPDSPMDAAAMLKESGVSNISTGTDNNFELTGKYMESFPLFPMAFLVNPAGVIVWCGEAADLPEAAADAVAGKLKTDDQRKLMEHFDQMLAALKSGKHDLIGKLSDAALKMDPGNAGIIRLRIFDLENRFRFKEAFELLREQIRKVPEKARLYMLALELAARHAELEHERNELLKELEKAELKDEEINLITWQLLQNAFDAEALKTAAILQKKIAREKDGIPPAQLASFDTTKALLLYRLGKVKEAYELESKLPELWQKAGLPQNAEAAQKRAEFYKAVCELAHE